MVILKRSLATFRFVFQVSGESGQYRAEVGHRAPGHPRVGNYPLGRCPDVHLDAAGHRESALGLGQKTAPHAMAETGRRSHPAMRSRSLASEKCSDRRPPSVTRYSSVSSTTE